MLMLKDPEVTEKKLILGDYITVHTSGLDSSQAHTDGIQINGEELFQRIRKQRGEVVQPVEKPAGDLIDVRFRVPGSDKLGWVNLSEAINDDDKIVA